MKRNICIWGKKKVWHVQPSWLTSQIIGPLFVHSMCYKPCLHGCVTGSSLLLQYKLLTLPLGIPAQQNVIRLSAFSETGVLQENTVFTILEQNGEITEGLFGIKGEAGRGIIFTTRYLNQSGLVNLKVQATTRNQLGQITYQSLFIIYISISAYPYWSPVIHKYPLGTGPTVFIVCAVLLNKIKGFSQIVLLSCQGIKFQNSNG